jgi:hypothetical protein
MKQGVTSGDIKGSLQCNRMSQQTEWGEYGCFSNILFFESGRMVEKNGERSEAIAEL